MNKREIIRKNADTEFKNFKHLELQKSKEEIFKDNYKIRFFDEVHDFLICKTDLEDEDMEIIISDGLIFIALLYDFYLSKEYTSINTWEDISDMISEYCNTERG